MAAPTPKLLREAEGEPQTLAKSQKRPSAAPRLLSTVVYADTELEPRKGVEPYSEEEIEEHNDELNAARARGIDIRYTQAALQETLELVEDFFKKTGMDIRYDITPEQLATLDEYDQEKLAALRKLYKEAQKSETLDRVENLIKLGGPDARLAYSGRELATYPSALIQEYENTRELLQRRNIISSELVQEQATPAFIAEQAMATEPPAPMVRQPAQFLPVVPAPAPQPVSVPPSAPAIEPILPVAPVRHAPPSQIVPQSPAELLAAVSRSRPPPMSAPAVNPAAMQATPTPAARAASVPLTRLESRSSSSGSTSSFVHGLTGGKPPRLGDKQVVVANYKDLSLCHQVTLDALNRAEMAMQILDVKHANAIKALINRAMAKNKNAKGAGTKPISFKKATSIALRAERWVYQAQAAAAKHMVKESKKCLHDMAGRPKRSTADKITTYAKRVANGQSGYVGPRGRGRTEQALKRLSRKNSRLQESLADQEAMAPAIARRKSMKAAAKLERAASRAASAQGQQ